MGWRRGEYGLRVELGVLMSRGVRTGRAGPFFKGDAVEGGTVT
jgi:hypothetical protein